MENIILFKIGLKADSNMKKAKKLINAGYGHSDGIAIFKTGSFSSSEEVSKYLTELKIPFASITMLSPKVV